MERITIGSWRRLKGLHIENTLPKGIASGGSGGGAAPTETRIARKTNLITKTFPSIHLIFFILSCAPSIYLVRSPDGFLCHFPVV
jgi:hypothetical protein